MANPSWDDLDQFIDPDEFGQTVEFELQDGRRLTVTGIFDAAYLSADLGEFDMDTVKPRFTAKASAVVGIRRGDEVRIDGDLYDVTGYPQPDGGGMAVIPMALVSA